MYNGFTPYFCDIALYLIHEKILKLTDCTSEVPVGTWMFGVTVGSRWFHCRWYLFIDLAAIGDI